MTTTMGETPTTMRVTPDTATSGGQAGIQAEGADAVLAHAKRFGLTTARASARVLAATVNISGSLSSGSLPVLQDLCGRGLLVARPLSAALSVFEPTHAAWGPGEGPPFGTLGGRALVRAYGALAFCCHGDRVRERVTPTEILAEFPAMGPVVRAQVDYFLDGESFGSVLVDASDQAPIRLCRKAVELLYRQLATEPVQAFHADGKFLFAVVTGEAGKAAALKSEFRRFRLPLRALVVTLPELASSLPKNRGPPRLPAIPSLHPPWWRPTRAAQDNIAHDEAVQRNWLSNENGLGRNDLTGQKVNEIMSHRSRHEDDYDDDYNERCERARQEWYSNSASSRASGGQPSPREPEYVVCGCHGGSVDGGLGRCYRCGGTGWIIINPD